MANINPGVLTSLRLEYQKVRNPYDSPRVLRAVLDEITRQVEDQLQGYFISPNLMAQAQSLVDSLCSMVHFRGVPLLKLLGFSLMTDPTTLGEMVFHIRPLSDDGRWLLQQMDLLKTEEVPHIEKATEQVPVDNLPTPRLKRVVEL